MLGHAHAMTGQQGEGVPLLREAVEPAAEGRRTREALFTTYLSEAMILARQVREAAMLGERALVLSQERSVRGF